MTDRKEYDKARRERQKAKKKRDIQLIEACVLEKWNVKALGCYIEDQNEKTSCVLCQMYNYGNNLCYGCPIQKVTKTAYCERTPFIRDCYTLEEEYDRIEDEIEFIISLLPKRHPWRNI